MTRDSSAAILDRAAALWASSREQYRDAMVSVGRLLQEYVVERVREGEPLYEKARLARGHTREAATATVARRLGVTGVQVTRLISVAAVVDLLSDRGDLGGLSYTAVRAFRVTVGRTPGRIRRHQNSARGLSLTERCAWHVKPACLPWAAALFRRAAREWWRADEVASAVGTRFTPGPQARRPVADSLTGHDNRPALVDLGALAATGTPRDLADMVCELVRRSPHAAELAKVLPARLAALAKERTLLGRE